MSRSEPIDASRLRGLGPDGWGAVLSAVRSELADREDLHDAAAAVRDNPASRLVAGPGRRRVEAVLLADPELASAVAARLSGRLRQRLAGAGDRGGRNGAASAPSPDEEELRRLREEADRLRERARELKEDRDAWRRRADGAEARTSQLEDDLARQSQRVLALEDRLDAARTALEAAEREERRSVERERRRHERRVAELEEELTRLRREEEEHRRGARRREEVARRASSRSRRVRDELAPRVTPGRPTALPADLRADTAEGAGALLGPGRLVLVDGYNLTLNHRGELALEEQRAWLVQLLANAVSTRRIRAVAVFDGREAGGSRPRIGRGKVEVRFTPEGITADDELVLTVEATDEPVVVVTDDRDLQERIAAVQGDVVPTGAFLAAVRG